ncbi:DUF4595 domain-containing protein [Parabacteroides sp. ZJ-118]|uniref:DUF4595 domain-containing protein n=1 Tax=Parabacteroides sp. ZJ-118 TaxID=2709398 RepID=UPI0013EB15BC|nr:DUF4595 domain-containing protein [Parabacteroides sp. ZJ-118]
MKTFRLIGMALLAVVMCVNFISCSDDDETKDDIGILTNTRKLVEIKIKEDDGDIEAIKFEYDSKGRVISTYEIKENGETLYHTNYSWGDGNLIAMGEDGTVKHVFANKHVKTSSFNYSSTSSCTYEYNDSGLLTLLRQNSFFWKEGQLTNLQSSSETYKYVYSGKTCKGWCPVAHNEVWERVAGYEEGWIFYAHPELVGINTNQLPDKQYRETFEGEGVTNFTYTFDDDGYVKSCTVGDTYRVPPYNETETIVYTFTWE